VDKGYFFAGKSVLSVDKPVDAVDYYVDFPLRAQLLLQKQGN